jgi:release factor glutamine methyltransferase
LLERGASIAAARSALTDAFRHAGLDTPELDARVLVGHALGLDHAKLAARADRMLDDGEVRAIAALAARRIAREPVARIVGLKEFWGLTLTISEATLVPRPETETVVEAALALVDTAGSRRRALRIADLGTGTGAILLALLSELPEAEGVGTDASLAALAVARQNATRQGLAARINFVACDHGAALAGGFDLVVSNPPYVASGDIAGLQPEARCDPRIALDGGTDGLTSYRAIATDALRLLAPTGHLVVELGMGQERAVASLLRSHGLLALPVRCDLAGIPRVLSARVATMTP